MQHTREDLVRFGSEKVRSQPNLFSNFKQYLEEDVTYIYPNGKLPNNCFSCTFNVTFEKWKNYVVSSEHYTKKIKKMSNTKTTYELKDPKTKIFFDGNILDKNSSDEAWNSWINYNPEDEKVLIRKSFFAKLPNSKKDANLGQVQEMTLQVTEVDKEKETAEASVKKVRRVGTRKAK